MFFFVRRHPEDLGAGAETPPGTSSAIDGAGQDPCGDIFVRGLEPCEGGQVLGKTSDRQSANQNLGLTYSLGGPRVWR